MKNMGLILALSLAIFSLPARSQNPSESQEAALKEVAFVHGGSGPFAVAGYRIGERALKELNESRSSFDIEVIHKAPAEVQWTCIADGVQAATGVSVGKMNLKIETATAEAVAFQTWGRRGSDKDQAVNLGVFYEDNASKKRWILKFDDAKTLTQIDEVFVTVEPDGGSLHPSGKRLLFAYLRIDPNHP